MEPVPSDPSGAPVGGDGATNGVLDTGPSGSSASRLNWLRAAVLGANDGIVATAGLVLGVAGASASRAAILAAGAAGVISGALSMASGEYVSVSTQRDVQHAVLEQERRDLRDHPAAELTELAQMYEAKGLDSRLARQVAEQLTAGDALRAHAEIEHGIDPDDLSNPWHAAWASAGAFAAGAVLPLLAMTTPESMRVALTVVAVVLALTVTGVLSSRAGSALAARSIRRNVLGGLLAMVVTYVIGHLVGAAV